MVGKNKAGHGPKAGSVPIRLGELFTAKRCHWDQEGGGARGGKMGCEKLPPKQKASTLAKKMETAEGPQGGKQAFTSQEEALLRKATT